MKQIVYGQFGKARQVKLTSNGRCLGANRLPVWAHGRRFLRSLARPAGAVALATCLTGCEGGVLDPKGPIGEANSFILINSLEIMLVIVVPTILAGVVFAWWFRASNSRAQYRPDFAYSGQIELIVWSIPILTILFLGGLIWVGSHELDPANPIPSKKTALPIQVISLDWKWLFIYPEQGVASVNEFVMPVGVPVRFSLTSATVMNSFFVPQLGSMIAVMNGMVTALHLQADHPGNYFGRSTQFSGDGFPGMQFTARAVSQDEFTAWVAASKQQGPDLDQAAFNALNRNSQNVTPFTFKTVDPNLFQALATQEIPPGGGPGEGKAGPGVRPVGEH